MSYRKLIALTVFGAAVFLQGCEDDDEVAARAECSASNIDFSSDADPKFATATPGEDNLFTVINTEAENADSELKTQAGACVSCLLDEGATYQAAAYQGTADTDVLDDTNFEDKLNCWQTNAAMKDCGATTDLPACTGTPCDSASVTSISTDGLEGDCALCVAAEDTSDDAKTAAALGKCGVALAALYDDCDGQTSGGSAGDVTYLDLIGTSYLTDSSANEPAADSACSPCINAAIAAAVAEHDDAGTEDVDECNLVKTIYTDVCGGEFTNTVNCVANS